MKTLKKNLLSTRLYLTLACMCMAFPISAEIAVTFGPSDAYVSADANFGRISSASEGVAINPFSDTLPLSPVSGYSGPTFYGGYQWTTTTDTRNFTRQQIRNNNTPEPLTDQMYFQVASPSANWDGAVLTVVGAIVFRQEDFLNGLSAAPLKLENLSMQTTAFFQGESANPPEVRFLVRVGGIYYLSQTHFPLDLGESNGGLDATALAAETWSPYDPLANLSFDQENAIFAALDLDAVTAVGLFFENDGWAGVPEKVTQFGVGIRSFEASGTSSQIDPEPSEEFALITYGPDSDYVSGDVNFNRLSVAASGVALNPFSDTEQLSPLTNYAGPRFFGGHQWTTTAETRNFTRQQIRDENTPAPTSDQIYFQVASPSATWDGSTLSLAGAVLFQKSDFADTAPEGIVRLNRITLQTTGFFHNEGTPEGRFLVRTKTGYFLSEATFDIGTEDLLASLDANADPAPQWAPYDPLTNLNFDQGSAAFEVLDLGDVTGLGLYFENDGWAGDPAKVAQFGFGIRSFEALGTATPDQTVDLWEDAIVLGDWRFLENFGWFSELGNGWIYHLNHGFLFPAGNSPRSLYLYDLKQATWVWASTDLPSWFYWLEPFNVWTYFEQGGVLHERFFYHTGFAEWRQVGDFERPSNRLYHEITPDWVNRATRVGPSQILANIVDGTLSTGLWDDAQLRRAAPVFTPNAFVSMGSEWTMSSDGAALGGSATAHVSLPEQSARNAPRRSLRRMVLLTADRPFVDGETITVRPSTGGVPLRVAIDPQAKSDLIHVAHHGWTPLSGDKQALLGGWFGPGVSSDGWLSENLRFAVVDDATGLPIDGWDFTDGHFLHKTRDANATQVTSGWQANNWQTMHDLYMADFSGLTTPGRYRVLVEDIGSSYPFMIAENVHQGLVRHIARGFIHLQHGDDRRGEAVHPALVIPPTMRHMEFVPAKRTFASISPDGLGDQGKLWEPSPIELEDDPQLAAFGVDHPTEGWRDAADYDIRPQHLAVATEMLLLAMRFPVLDTYDLGRAEHGEAYDKTIRGTRIQGTVPLSDLAHTALYCGDAWTRLQIDTEGFWKDSVRGGFELRGYIGGNTDFQSFATRFKDIDKAYLLRPDPWATFAYAGFAATAAIYMDMIGEYSLKDFYEERALRAWAWAAANESRTDLEGWNPNWRSKFTFRDAKALAAAALWGLTGEDIYHNAWDAVDENTQPILSSGRAISARAYLIFHQIGYREGRSARLSSIRGNVITAYQSILSRANADPLTDPSAVIFNRPVGTRGNAEYGYNINNPYATWFDYLPILLLLDDPATGFTSVVRDNLRTWTEAELSFAAGRNPLGKSFITGFGFDSPRALHHNDLQGTGLKVAFPGLMAFGLLSNRQINTVINSSGFEPTLTQLPYPFRVVFGPDIHPNQGEFTPQNSQWQLLVAAIVADILAEP